MCISCPRAIQSLALRTGPHGCQFLSRAGKFRSRVLRAQRKRRSFRSRGLRPQQKRVRARRRRQNCCPCWLCCRMSCCNTCCRRGLALQNITRLPAHRSFGTSTAVRHRCRQSYGRPRFKPTLEQLMTFFAASARRSADHHHHSHYRSLQRELRSQVAADNTVSGFCVLAQLRLGRRVRPPRRAPAQLCERCLARPRTQRTDAERGRDPGHT